MGVFFIFTQTGVFANFLILKNYVNSDIILIVTNHNYANYNKNSRFIDSHKIIVRRKQYGSTEQKSYKDID